MAKPKLALLVTVAISVVVLLMATAAGYAISRLDSPVLTAAASGPTPSVADAVSPPPVPELLSRVGSQPQPAAFSPNLSYYFISGNTFTAYSGTATPYIRGVNGCVNQMPLGHPFSASVNLPQGSQVVSITLYTYDSVVITTTSTAYFIIKDGKGVGGYTVSASSQPNVANYQQNQSTQNNPWIIDNENNNYVVEWRKNLGTIDSTYLSLCGIRVAYYAPMGSIYLPLIMKNQSGQ